MHEQQRILDGVLRSWADHIRAHEPERVAALFTADAVFQGFDRTHGVGREAIRAYYAKQPVGLSPAVRVEELEPLGPDAFLAFVDTDFTRPDGEVIPFSHFFTPSLSVKDIIKEMIEKEGRPLTDAQIAERLRERGIEIARRTVAKYRMQLDILPSSLR